MIQKATEHCVYLHAQSRQSWDHCDQLHERHDSHRRDNRAPLSTMRAVCRWVIQLVHTVTLAQGPRPCLVTSSHPCMCTWLFERPLPSLSLQPGLCHTRHTSKHFLYFRTIQGHSGGNTIDPELQDNVLLPIEFTEYFDHVRNFSEMHSIIRSGLIPGGRSLKRRRQSVFFTPVNPMNDDKGMEETPCDLTKPRIAPYRKTWKPLQNTVYWCNLKLAQQRGLQCYQTRSHAIVLYNTLFAACIEEAVCMKTKEEQNLKVFLTPWLPRVVLKPNSHSGQQDQQEQDARSSCDHPSGSKSSGETWCNNVDYRIRGIPLSTVEQRGTNRKDKVKRLIQQFERATRTRSLSCRTWTRRRRSTSLARIVGADRRYEQYGDLWALRDLFQEVPIVIYIGRSALFVSPVEDVKNRRKELRSSTRTTTTSF